MHEVAVATRRGAQLHLRITSRRARLRYQTEQLTADVPGGIGRIRVARIRVARMAVKAGQVLGDAGSRRPALQLRGQGQGRLAERHAIKYGRGRRDRWTNWSWMDWYRWRPAHDDQISVIGVAVAAWPSRGSA